MAKKNREIEVSVVVPTLNEEALIEKCLKSLKAQEFRGNFEIIVADGNSEDKTRQIAKKLADKVIVEKKRSGAFERNAGAKAAKGKIIAFIDSDGIAEKNWLQIIWNSFEKNPNQVLAYGSVFYSDAKGLDAKLPEIIVPNYLGVFEKLGCETPLGANIAVKRSAFEKVKGFDCQFITCEDINLAKRMKELGEIKFEKKMIVYVSARRMKKWGFLYHSLFHMSNMLKYYAFGKAHRKYEEIR